MAVPASEAPPAEHEGNVRSTAQRSRNEQTASAEETTADAQGLIEFVCECTQSDCERSVRVPLYVYRRIVDAGDQCLLHAGHHGFDRYRTIVAVGLMRIEERA
jgi:hypothetical protein